LEKNKSRVVHDGERLLLDSRFAGDEPFMLARSLRDVPVVVDKDRVRAALHAVRELGCDILILDDGMQYLTLGRRIEIVLVDCQAPFGNRYLLPRGTLREPPRNLRRARYIFLTKSDGVRQDQLIEEIREFNRRRRSSSPRTGRSTCRISMTRKIGARSTFCAGNTSARSVGSRGRRALRESWRRWERRWSSRSGSRITTVSPTRNCATSCNGRSGATST
jgi:tetraacyldisaccharide-1-P 4'-kinase